MGVKELMFWFCGLSFWGILVLGGKGRSGIPQRTDGAEQESGRTPASLPLVDSLRFAAEKHVVPSAVYSVRRRLWTLSLCLIVLDLAN